MNKLLATLCLMILGQMYHSAEVQSAEPSELIDIIKRVGPQGQGQTAAVVAVKELQQLPPQNLLPLLTALNDANPLAANWLRSAVESVFARAVTKPDTIPTAAMQQFALDTKQSGAARRLAFELLTRVDSQTPDRLLPKLLDDPSLELRRDAVESALAKLTADQKKPELAPLQQLFTKTRDLDQIEKFATLIREQNGEVDLPKHLGFIMEWQLIGPFDNSDKKGYPVAYPPETEQNLGKTYAGKEAPVKWQAHVSSDQYGLVDLNQVIGKHKGAVAYALAEITVANETPCQLRLGCINANKIWLNGQLVFEREVYHALTNIDQYTATGLLKPGRNMILLKVCQNEQTEQWAQDWAFQLRVCDPVGTAILSQQRPATPAAALLPPPKKMK